MNKNRLLIVVIILLALWNVFSTVYFNSRLSERLATHETTVNNFTVNGFSTDLTGTVKNARSSMVTVDAGGTASGFIYRYEDEKTYIVTAYHAVSSGANIYVTFDSGYRKDAVVLGYDIYADLAVLEVEMPYESRPVKMGSLDTVQDGEFVLLIGSPLSGDYQGSAALSMVSKHLITLENSITLEEDRNYEYYLSYIQLSEELKEGYSGAAVLDMDGGVLGMVTMKDPDAGFTFALPADDIRILADTIIEGEEIHHGSLGIKGTFISEMANYQRSSLNLPLEVTEGLYIREMEENALAYISGLRPGDVLLSVNEMPVSTYSELLRIEYGDHPEYHFRFVRNGETLDLYGSVE